MFFWYFHFFNFISHCTNNNSFMLMSNKQTLTQNIYSAPT